MDDKLWPRVYTCAVCGAKSNASVHCLLPEVKPVAKAKRTAEQKRLGLTADGKYDIAAAKRWERKTAKWLKRLFGCGKTEKRTQGRSGP
jgi:hypothetical protein